MVDEKFHKKFMQVTETTLLISDYVYYAENEIEIDKWNLDSFSYQPRQGMVLDFANKFDLLIFILRWS